MCRSCCDGRGGLRRGLYKSQVLSKKEFNTDRQLNYIKTSQKNLLTDPSNKFHIIESNTSKNNSEYFPPSDMIASCLAKSDFSQNNDNNTTWQIEKQMMSTFGIKTFPKKSFNRESSFSNEYLQGDLTRTKFRYYLKERALNGRPINSQTIRLFFNQNSDKFCEDKFNDRFVLKTKNLQEGTQDPIIQSLESLDKLHSSLPDYRMRILKLKKQNIEVEKLKIKMNFQNTEINNKLDTLLSQNEKKLAWDKIDLKKIEYLKNKALSTERRSKSYMKNTKTNNVILSKDKADISVFQATGKKFEPKFKKFGANMKVLILPKAFQVENCKKLNNSTKVRKELQSIVDLQKTSLKNKKYLDSISSPKKTKEGPLNKLASKCEQLYERNLRLMNQIISTKKTFKKESLYMNPKSAFIILNN